MDVLIIGSWSSRCGTCGKDADPHQRIHAVLLGYGSQNGQPGCMVEWDAVTSEYDAPNNVAAVKAMRPDLRYVDYSEVTR